MRQVTGHDLATFHRRGDHRMVKPGLIKEPPLKLFGIDAVALADGVDPPQYLLSDSRLM